MAYTITWNSGSTLLGINAKESDDSDPNVNWFEQSAQSGDIIGIIGEGKAANQITPGHWVGSMINWKPQEGFWLNANSAGTATFTSAVSASTEALYDLEIGNNLISVPGEPGVSYPISSAFLSAVTSSITGVIGEGVAATYDTELSGWIGSLIALTAGKGYWINSSSGLSEQDIFSVTSGVLACSITGDPGEGPQGGGVFNHEVTPVMNALHFHKLTDNNSNPLPNGCKVSLYKPSTSAYCGFTTYIGNPSNADWFWTVGSAGQLDSAPGTSGYFQPGDKPAFRVWNIEDKKYYSASAYAPDNTVVELEFGATGAAGMGWGATGVVIAPTATGTQYTGTSDGGFSGSGLIVSSTADYQIIGVDSLRLIDCENDFQ